MSLPQFDPEKDLKLERVVDVPRNLIWRAWTEPKHLLPWFCPKPWSTVACEIDLRPGGKFNTTMRSPEGKDYPNDGCYLEVVPNERLVFTNCLHEGFRPAHSGAEHCGDGLLMTAHLILEDLGNGKTRYTAYALHNDTAGRDKHEQMGFTEGWGTVLTQLVEYCKEQM